MTKQSKILEELAKVFRDAAGANLIAPPGVVEAGLLAVLDRLTDDKALTEAAPDLLSALKDLRDWIRYEVEIDGCKVPTYTARLRAAESAIKKAERRT